MHYHLLLMILSGDFNMLADECLTSLTQEIFYKHITFKKRLYTAQIHTIIYVIFQRRLQTLKSTIFQN